MGESKSTSTLKEMHICRKFYAGEIVDNQVKKFEIVIDKTELYWQNSFVICKNIYIPILFSYILISQIHISQL